MANTTHVDEYTEHMEQDMQKLVKEPTDKRLKIILLASKDSMRKLLHLLGDGNADDFERYKIPRKIYDGFYNHVFSVVKKKCTKGINFRRVTTKQNGANHQKKVYKNHWFYNAPKEMSRYLWVPLLTNIAQYFHRMASVYAATNSRHWSECRIEMFLKLRFIKNIFEAKCQINSQSNPCGPVIQFAVWKIPSMQNVVNQCYDDSFSTQWTSWLANKDKKGKKMRINKIIRELVKPYANERFRAFCVSNHISSQTVLNSLEITSNRIRKMKLSRYFCQDNDVNFPSDRSLSDSKADSETVDETVSVPHMNNLDNVIIPHEYKGYHRGVDLDATHPVTDRVDAVAARKTKCARCRKCKYHCRCEINDGMWMRWMQHRYNLLRRYSYLMSSQCPYFGDYPLSTPSAYARGDNVNHVPLNYDMNHNNVKHNDHEVDSLFAGNFGTDSESTRMINNDDVRTEDIDMFPCDELNLFPEPNYGDASCDTSTTNNSCTKH